MKKPINQFLLKHIAELATEFYVNGYSAGKSSTISRLNMAINESFTTGEGWKFRRELEEFLSSSLKKGFVDGTMAGENKVLEIVRLQQDIRNNLTSLYSKYEEKK
jgi:hypothetical protein